MLLRQDSFLNNTTLAYYFNVLNGLSVIALLPSHRRLALSRACRALACHNRYCLCSQSPLSSLPFAFGIALNGIVEICLLPPLFIIFSLSSFLLTHYRFIS
ncbi:hypothetical protein BJX64DRAFT_53951 [Aspergillus heterothallicus]